MQTLKRPWFLAVVLVVLVTGAFVGLAAAHDDGGDSTREECEMQNDADDCPMMDGMMMGGGMMQTGDDCPMDDGEGMMGMGMHDDSAHDHDDCPMH